MAELSWVSMIGAAMSIIYSFIAIVLCFVNGVVPEVSYAPGGPGVSTVDL